MSPSHQLKLRYTQALARVSKFKQQHSELESQLKEAQMSGKDTKRLIDRIQKNEESLQKARLSVEKYQKDMDGEPTVKASSSAKKASGERKAAGSKKSSSAQKSPSEMLPASRGGLEGGELSSDSIRELLEQRDREWMERFDELSRRMEKHQGLSQDVEAVFQSIEPQFREVEETLSALDLHLDEMRRMSDRLLLLEAQVRDLQTKFRKMDERWDHQSPSSGGWKSDIQSLRRKLDGIRDQQRRFDRLIGEDSPYLETYGARPDMEALSDLKLPWPREMTLMLREWVRGRSAWSHVEWLELLGFLAENGYSEFTDEGHQEAIGRFLEAHR